MPEADRPAGRTAIALLHHPVYDKNRLVVTTAVTNLDIHDIARAAKSFGIFRYYIVTPVTDQQELTERIRRHWVEGWGAGYNPKRSEALELLKVVSTLDDAVSDLAEEFDSKPLMAVTGAQGFPGSISTETLSKRQTTDTTPLLMVFGTGWGLTEDVFDRADIVLEPIKGTGTYNHLSVRSAVSIYLDRLFGSR